MISMAYDEYLSGNEGAMGFCLACKAEAYGVEPDAREYRCEACGQCRVFGCEELLMMGELKIVD
jgi:hypothetical protein